MERGNPRADVKGVYQAEEPQDKSTNAAMGADWVVVVNELKFMGSSCNGNGAKDPSYSVSRISQL